MFILLISSPYFEPYIDTFCFISSDIKRFYADFSHFQVVFSNLTVLSMLEAA